MANTKLNNKTLRTSVDIDLSPQKLHINKTYHCYGIIATRDGVRKYITHTFPSKNGYLYSVKIQNARLFKTADEATDFIAGCKDYKFAINEPEICAIVQHFHDGILTISLL